MIHASVILWARLQLISPVFNPSRYLTCVSVEEVENGLRTFLYIRTTGFTTKTGHRQNKLGSLIKKSRETAARTGPNRMGRAFHHTNDECEGQNRSAMLHAALHNTGMLPSYKQTLHAWLLKTLPPTVQTPRLCVFDLSVTLACAECLTASQSAPNGSYGPYGHITSMGNA